MALIPDNVTSISSAVGFSSPKAQKLPWDLKDQNEAFFKPLDIDADRWDKLFPYRFLVVDIEDAGKIVGNSSFGSGGLGTITSKKSAHILPDNKGISYVLTQEIANGSWELNLPITPQMLRITDQYSINNTPTMRGIVEEHNGVKYKTISASGSTGIWARRPTIGGVPKSPSSVGSIFAGTLSSISNVLNDAKRVKKAFSGSHPASVSDAKTPHQDSSTIFSTGYYQALYMGQFLERYAQAKKDPKNKGWRLVFDIPKQKKSFIVTPVMFSLEQSQQKPMEYIWSIQLRAWKRISLESPQPASNELPKLDANTFQKIVGTIRETRRLIADSLNVIKSVRSDFRNSLEILRQTMLAVKDVAGLVNTVMDLPNQLRQDFNSAILDTLKDVKNSFKRGTGSESSISNGVGFTSASLRSNSQESKAGAAINKILAQYSVNEGLSSSAVKGGALGVGPTQALQTSDINNIFENSDEYYDLFDSVDIESLSLTREQQEAIDNELERVRLLTVDDFRNFRSEIESLALDLSNSFGSGNSTFSDIYGKTAPKDRVFPMTIEENEILLSLFDAIQAYDLLISTKRWDDLSVDSPLQYVGGLANASAIDFEQTTAKILVPVPFGLTIEEIAARYLKNPDRWIEIATLNKLTSPYIDEEGFTYNFLSNGDGRQFNVDDSAEKLYLGQKISIKSDTVPVFVRKINAIDKISDGNYLITVDGLANLNSLTTIDNAYIKAYLPGTINSQNQIYIPIDLPAQDDDRIQLPNHLNEDVYTRISKVDWLLTDSGDLAINQLGDLQLANGLTNLIQALKLKIKTKKGTLLRHLDYGLGIKHGMSSADIESGEIINSMNKMIEDDPRFDRVDRISLALNGNKLSIDMSVKLSNGSGVVPITFDV